MIAVSINRNLSFYKLITILQSLYLYMNTLTGILNGHKSFTLIIGNSSQFQQFEIISAYKPIITSPHLALVRATLI